MPSDFDAFMSASLDESFAVFGALDFVLDGQSYTKAGVINEYDSARELEIGGFVGSFNATLLCKRSKFTETTGTLLERTLDGKLLVIQGRTFRIAKASVDETGVLLGLVNPK